MGPLFQIIFYIIFFNVINSNYLDMFKQYNYLILIFNLLPIYPLDGGKLLNLLFNKYFSFKWSFMLSSFLSIIIFLVVIIFLVNLKLINTLNLVILLFLLFNIFKELRNINYYWGKFLVERLINNYDFKKEKYISSLRKMKRDYYHYIFAENKYELEKEYLKKKYYV